MTIAEIVIENTGKAEIELTEDGLAVLYPEETTPDLTDEATPDRLDSLSDDMGRIAESVDTIGSITGADTGENDLSESFDEFQSDLDADGDESITQQELQNYIGNL